MNCQICTGDFARSPDAIVACGHHNGFVHLGCCIYNCSKDKKPCFHAAGVYDKF